MTNCTAETYLNLSAYCLDNPNDIACYPNINLETIPSYIIIPIICTWTILNIIIGSVGNLITIVGLIFSTWRKYTFKYLIISKYFG